jgi:hypothetical protein
MQPSEKVKSYKEKQFTKAQRSRIETARKAIDWLMAHGVEVHGRQYNLCFFREENIAVAENSGRWPTSNGGDDIFYESIDITDSGADDPFKYPEDVTVLKE